MLLVLRWTLSTEIEKGKLMLTCVIVQTKITRKEKGMSMSLKFMCRLFMRIFTTTTTTTTSRKQMLDVINTKVKIEILDVNIVNVKSIIKDRNGKQIPVVIKVKLKISNKESKRTGGI